MPSMGEVIAKSVEGMQRLVLLLERVAQEEGLDLNINPREGDICQLDGMDLFLLGCAWQDEDGFWNSDKQTIKLDDGEVSKERVKKHLAEITDVLSLHPDVCAF